MSIHNFLDLTVWNKAHQLTLEIYQLTKSFPSDELYGLVGQMRRSAISICANIAEGHKKSTKDYARFIQIANGSLEETRYHLILCRDLNYISNINYNKSIEKVDEIGKMLNGLRKKLI